MRAVRPALLALLLAAAAIAPGPAAAAATWSRNVYASGALVYQDPYYTACVAAATMTMLNTIAAREAGGPGFTWTRYRVKNDAGDPSNLRDMVSILAFARANDTLRLASRGTDAHGWRNALNYYGWGQDATTDPSRMVYQDRAYRTFNAAVKAAVKAIARRGMPVGILGWSGGHAQVMTGYVVAGQDPAASSDFEVRYVFLTDPLRLDGMANKRLSLEQLRSGSLRFRFQRYRKTDSPYRDPYTGSAMRSAVKPDRGPSEWFGRWVIVAPVRAGLVIPPADPVVTRDPSGTPPSGPVATASPPPDPTLASPTEPTPPPDPTPTAPPPDPTPTAPPPGADTSPSPASSAVPAP